MISACVFCQNFPVMAFLNFADNLRKSHVWFPFSPYAKALFPCGNAKRPDIGSDWNIWLVSAPIFKRFGNVFQIKFNKVLRHCCHSYFQFLRRQAVFIQGRKALVNKVKNLLLFRAGRCLQWHLVKHRRLCIFHFDFLSFGL